MSGLYEISGRCHCGNIEYAFISPVPKMELPIKSCDCSFCIKQGACYTSHPHGKLEVSVKDRSKINRYQFGSESADVFLCSQCGVFPFIVSQIDDQLYAVLNANSINGLKIDQAKVVPIEHVENQSTEERAERWKKNWISKVEITYKNQVVNPALLEIPVA
ncbi:GFA family protein [Malonomonas rubra]|uniref:GFA family protein n=1 Tax=Malonomonas rubra TaxID=57040 RepID=UPI0026F0C2AA|nr:hypothetical protein [Malonomonas rubra]